MKGVTEYKTKSGFQVARVHYTADPDKDPATEKGQEWLKRALEGVKGGQSSSAWRKEMEIDFSARRGERVFEGLELIKDKVLIKPFQIPEYWKVTGGYDWGKRNPFAYLEGAIDSDGNKFICYGAYGSGYTIGEQANFIKKSPYKARILTRWADPSIWTENQVAKDGSYTSFERLFSDLDVHFARGKTDDIVAAERLEAEWFDMVPTIDGFKRVPKENPTLKIFLPYLFLWDELIELRWADFSAVVEENRGKKEEIQQLRNHAFDALKYWLLALPLASIKPKPRSKDPAIPLAMELIGSKPQTSWERWNT